MSIQMNLVFGVLVGQMSALVLLLLPLPHAIRKRMVRGAAAAQQNSNFRVIVAFATVLLGLQFLDCFNKVRRFAEGDPFGSNVQLTHDRLASKFYAQRNLYLSGAVLYLELAIGVVVTILRKLVAKEEAYREQVGVAPDAPVGEDTVVDDLKKQIAQKDADIAALRKQLDGVQTAYDGLLGAPAKSKHE